MALKSRFTRASYWVALGDMTVLRAFSAVWALLTASSLPLSRLMSGAGLLGDRKT